MVVEAFGRTKTAQETSEDIDDEPGEPEQPLTPVPTLGQVAAARANATRLPTGSAPAEP